MRIARHKGLFVVSLCTSAALCVLLGLALVGDARASDADLGASAATFDEVFSLLLGCGLGLALGTAVCVAYTMQAVRIPSSPSVAAAGGLAGYLALVTAAIAYSGKTTGVGVAALLLIPAAVFVALGTLVGAFAGRLIRSFRARV